MRLVLDPLPEPQRVAALLEAHRSYLGHDLATQLVAIQGFARLLAEGGLTDEEGRDIARQLAALARQADERARRLAQFARLLAEPAGPPLSLLSAAREAAEDARIAYHIQGTDWRVPVSPRLLQAVLSLLLANARPSGPALVETGEG
ncbi:MAG: hypothetical protein K2W96_18935, partial [Gemmataceae bacterium]|nr:hypothetical protein [Gemmataceae bacterium]